MEVHPATEHDEEVGAASLEQLQEQLKRARDEVCVECARRSPTNIERARVFVAVVSQPKRLRGAPQRRVRSSRDAQCQVMAKESRQDETKISHPTRFVCV